jgi:hypothetical protein
MRAVIILAGAALTLTACGNNDQSDNTANVDENLTAENIVANDVTAIDAVTGDAANMAADVNFESELDNNLDNVTTPVEPAKPVKRSEKTRAPAPDTGPPAPANTSGNATE